MKYLQSLVLITLFFSHYGLAQSLSDDLQTCAEIENSLKRLVCFDELVKQTKGKPKSEAKLPPPVDKPRTQKPQAPVDAESQFGQEYKQSTDEMIQQISAKASKVKKSAYGNLILTLDNGQVWRQSDSTRIKISEGDVIYIKRGALGSFFIGKEGSNKRIRAKRVK